MASEGLSEDLGLLPRTSDSSEAGTILRIALAKERSVGRHCKREDMHHVCLDARARGSGINCRCVCAESHPEHCSSVSSLLPKKL